MARIGHVLAAIHVVRGAVCHEAKCLSSVVRSSERSTTIIAFDMLSAWTDRIDVFALPRVYEGFPCSVAQQKRQNIHNLKPILDEDEVFTEHIKKYQLQNDNLNDHIIP